MTRLGTIPIYFETNDERIKAYLQKNITHHKLISPTKPKGNGNIRNVLIGAFIGMPTVVAFYYALWFLGVAMGVQ